MTLESTIVALAIHAGHIKYLLSRQPRSPRTRRLRPLPNAIVDMLPATCNSLAMIVLNQSEGRMPELNQRPPIHLAQAVLHVGNDRIGHKQWPRNFQQCRALDGLHISPKVAVAIAQVAVPSAAWPRLDPHGHGLGFGRFVEWSDLFQESRKGRFQRRTHADFLCD